MNPIGPIFSRLPPDGIPTRLAWVRKYAQEWSRQNPKFSKEIYTISHPFSPDLVTKLPSFDVGLLNLTTVDILGQIIYCCMRLSCAL